MPRDGDGDYEVGYGKPPRHSRFVKGRCGNPRGRPRGAKSFSALLSDKLNEPVTVAENGGRRKISKREAIVTQLVNRSAAADFRAIKILLGIVREIERQPEPVSREAGELGEADAKVFEQIKARFAERDM
jgi:hypothetical protein